MRAKGPTRADRTSAGRGRGLTLIELLIVMAIVSVWAAIAVPRFANSITRQRAATAAKRIAADLSMARDRARHTSQSSTVTFSGSGYVVSGIRHLDHPSDTYKVDLSANPYEAEILSVDFGGDPEVIFDIYGTPDSAGTVVVAVATWQHTVTLDSETGKTNVE